MGRDTLKTLGATNLSKAERSYLDYYSTDPRSVRAILEQIDFGDTTVWDPGSGRNMIINVLKEAGYKTYSTDIYDYGCQDKIIDFLECNEKWEGSILMNPPYNLALEFVLKALELTKPGAKVVVFLRTLFLEGTKRYEKLFKDNPPKNIYVFSNRQVCSKVDDHTVGSAVSYSFFEWEKGFKGSPTIKWIQSKK